MIALVDSNTENEGIVSVRDNIRSNLIVGIIILTEMSFTRDIKTKDIIGLKF